MQSVFTSIVLSFFTLVSFGQTANFFSSHSEGCVPLEISLTDASMDATSWQWQVSGPQTFTSASQHPEFVFSDTGTYIVQLTINGGASSISKEIEVGIKPNLTAFITPNDICLNIEVNGQATSDIPNTQFYWFFEGAGNPVDGGIGTTSTVLYTYEDEWSQPFFAKLIGNANGCADTIINEVTVNPPAAKFSWIQSCGLGTEVNFNPNILEGVFSNNVTWKLVSGPGSPAILGTFENINVASFTHDFGNLDVYGVQLIVESDLTTCVDSITKVIDLFSQTGNATVTPRSVCKGEAVSFFDNQNNIVSWQWSFGDGDTSNLVNIPTTFTHAYEEAGIYTAELFTRNNIDCYDTTNYTITIGGGIADIGGVFGSCNLPFTISFNSSPSIFPFGGIETANWVVDDGTGPHVFNDALSVGPFTYNTPGQYTVSLTAIDSSGCFDDTTVSIIVGGVVADFSANTTSVCPGDSVYFTNLSLGGNLTYSWSFPGGSPSTSTDENPIVIYSIQGNYSVMLSVTSNGATTCSDDTTWVESIEVGGSGYDFVVDNDNAFCPPLVSNFSIVPAPSPGELSYIKWYFELSSDFPEFSGDAVLEDQVNATNIYVARGLDDNGFYDVALVLEGNSCRDSIYKDDFIFVGGQSGDINADKDTVLVGEEVVFSISNITNTDTIILDFGDGTSVSLLASVDMVVKQYDNAGTYNASAMLISDECLPSLTNSVEVVVLNDTSTSTFNFQENIISVVVFPNPIANQAIYKIDGKLNFNYDLVLTDITGKAIRSYLNESANQVIIEKGNLPSGLYFLNLYENNKKQLLVSHKVVIE